MSTQARALFLAQRYNMQAVARVIAAAIIANCVHDKNGVPLDPTFI